VSSTAVAQPRLSSTRPPSALREGLRETATAYLFLLPGFLFFGAFLLLPIAWVVRQSFQQGGVLGTTHWVGLANWKAAFHDPNLLAALKHTGVYTAMVVPLTVLVALGLGVLMRNVRRGGAVFRTLIYLPSLAPPALLALIWIFVVHPDFGLLNITTRTLGYKPINFLGDPNLALPTLAMLDVWRSVGSWALLIYAGLSMIPMQLYQSAEIDGASSIRRFWHVSLPGVRGVVAVVCILTLVVSMQVFDSVFLLTKGSPEGSTTTAVYYIYTSVFQDANPGYGAVLSIILLVAIMALTGVIAWLVTVALRRRSGDRGSAS
jgi:multiple sugar transport system permease protein